MLTRAPLGYPAERVALGRGGKYYPLVISRTKHRRETGQAAIESSQQELSNVFLFFFLNRSQVMTRPGQRSEVHQFRLPRAEFFRNLCTNRSERFYKKLVHNHVPE